MTIQNLITVLDQWAPPAYAEDFDNVGLLVGDPKKKMSWSTYYIRLYRGCYGRSHQQRM